MLKMLNERVTQTGAEDYSNFRIYYALTFKKAGCILYLIKHIILGTTNKIGIDRVKRKNLISGDYHSIASIQSQPALRENAH